MENVDRCFYINLDECIDRRTLIEGELAKLALPFVERFSAIKHEKGYIGCTLSHIACLRKAIHCGYSCVFVCEDDMVIQDATELQRSVERFFRETADGSWDVLIICGNVLHPVKVHSPVALRVYNCQTTSGYIVAKHYLPVLLQNFEQGMDNLHRNPRCDTFRIDMFWKHLQRRDRWYAIQPFNAYQAPGLYSTIEKKVVDYKDMMLRVGF